MTSIRPLGAVPKTGKQKKHKESTLDKWFSLYIRLRDSATNSGGQCRCFTCGAVDHYKDMDVGHFIPRGKKPTRFNPENAKAQCRKCNRLNSGEVDKFARILGVEISSKLREISRKPYKKPSSEAMGVDIELFRDNARVEAHRVGVEIY